jgi:murein DD-endopeptidase
MLGSLSVLTLAVAVWRPYIYHPESAPIVRTIELEKSEIRSLLPEASEPIDQAPQEEEAIPQDELDEKPIAMPAVMNMWCRPAIRSAAS